MASEEPPGSLAVAETVADWPVTSWDTLLEILGTFIVRGGGGGDVLVPVPEVNEICNVTATSSIVIIADMIQIFFFRNGFISALTKSMRSSTRSHQSSHLQIPFTNKVRHLVSRGSAQ